MTLDQVIDKIQDACGEYDGDELSLMQGLETLAEGWRMRLQELEGEAD